MDVLQLGLAIVLGLTIVYLFFSRQQAQYKAHVSQLQPKKKAKPAYRSDYTREEVAKHKTKDDAWVVIKVSLFSNPLYIRKSLTS